MSSLLTPEDWDIFLVPFRQAIDRKEFKMHNHFLVWETWDLEFEWIDFFLESTAHRDCHPIVLAHTLDLNTYRNYHSQLYNCSETINDYLTASYEYLHTDELHTGWPGGAWFLELQSHLDALNFRGECFDGFFNDSSFTQRQKLELVDYLLTHPEYLKIQHLRHIFIYLREIDLLTQYLPSPNLRPSSYRAWIAQVSLLMTLNRVDLLTTRLQYPDI